MKLGTKINLVIVFITTIILTATFAVIVSTEAETTKNQVLRDARASADVFHKEVERMFKQLYEQRERLQGIVDELSNIEGVVYINVTNMSGVHLAATDHTLVGTRVNENDLTFIKEIGSGKSIADIRTSKGTFYELERRIPVHAIVLDDSSDVISVIEVEVTTHSKGSVDIAHAEKLLKAISASINQSARLVVMSQVEDTDAIQTITDSISNLGKANDSDEFGFFKEFIISDNKLSIIASTNRDSDLFRNDTQEHNKYREDVLSGSIPEAFYESVIDGYPVFVSVRPIQVIIGAENRILGLKETHLLVSAYADKIAALELRMLVIGVILTVVLVMALVAVLERQVVGPIRRFSVVAQKIAAGDLNQKVEHTAKDEIGQFGDVFNSMVANFRELDRLKSDFISVAAHQLRTPLSGLKWVLKLVLDGDLGPINEEQKSMLTNGFDTNEKMIQLVNDLLNVSRIENAKFGYDFKKGDFMKLLDTLIENTALTSKQRSIEVQFVNNAGEIPEFLFDPDKLAIALQNIVDNALKYTLSGGKVIIAVEKKGDYIEVKVSDTGVGVPSADIQKLFSKFFRASNVIHLQTDGSGLGLFIVKSIITRHGGQIKVESVEGKGTTIIVTVPTLESLIPKDEEGLVKGI